MLLELLPAGGPAGARSATVVGHRVRLGALDAALVNGTASHVLDFDDVNLAFLGHASVAVLGAARWRSPSSSTQRRGARCAPTSPATRPPAGSRRRSAPSPTCGASTPPARSARSARPRRARACSGSTRAAPPWRSGSPPARPRALKCNLGTMTKSLHAGKACENGLLAALLAAARLHRRPPTRSRPSRGSRRSPAARCDAAAALADPPVGLVPAREPLQVPRRLLLHPLHDRGAARAARAESPLAPSDVERVTIHVSELELGACVIPEPSTGLEVKFSLAHLAAMTILGRSTASIDDADAVDPDSVRCAPAC